MLYGKTSDTGASLLSSDKPEPIYPDNNSAKADNKHLPEMTFQLRLMSPSEYPLLEDFLYEAIFLPEGIEPLPRSIVRHPDLQIYIEGFGTRRGDVAVAAEVDGKIAGAAWARIMNDYGHVDDDTPSLSIALYKEYRRRGIGTALWKYLLEHLKEEGYEKASLSVQKANFATKIYRDSGFRVVKENEEDYVMVANLLSPSPRNGAQ